MATDGKAPWLEAGVGEFADKAIEAQGGVSAEVMAAAGIMSAAITFKRIVDLLEPLAKAATAEMEAELKAAKGKKG